MNKNSAKYLQGISFSQLTFTYKTGIKNIRLEIFAAISPSNASHNNPSRSLIIIKSHEPTMISTAKLLILTDNLTSMIKILFLKCITLHLKISFHNTWKQILLSQDDGCTYLCFLNHRNYKQEMKNTHKQIIERGNG
jgi:hypothetical protein